MDDHDEGLNPLANLTDDNLVLLLKLVMAEPKGTFGADVTLHLSDELVRRGLIRL